MIRVTKQNLQEGLKIVGGAISSRTTLPVLENVRLEASDKTLQMVGTDLEQFVIANVPCGSGELETTVPFRLFNNLVATMPDMLDLELKDSTLHVSGRDVESDLATIDISEYPFLPSTSELDPISLDAQTLKGLIQETIHAVADDQSRPVLTGICVQATGDELVFVSADGFRMAVSRIPFTGTPATAIIPKSTMSNIVKALDKRETDVDMFIEPGTRLLVCLPEDTNFAVDVYGQAIAGNFVNYEQIIPTARDSQIVVDRDAMTQAIKQAGILGGLHDNRVLISLVDGDVEIQSENMEIGGTKSIVHPIETTGEFVELCANARFLLDALSTMGDVVYIDNAGAHRPIMLYTEKDKHLCVVMPMFVRK